MSDDDYDRAQALDWIAPEDDSRPRIFVFKYLPILFLCVMAYFPAWRGEFLWQDDAQVTANNPLRSPAGLGLIWTAPTSTPTWAPLAYTLLWPQHLIWSDRTPVGYHLINLFLHSFTAFCLWMLLRRLAVPGAFVAALVFALHPIQVESVGWIARQPLLLGAMWGVCFLLVYLRWSGADTTVPNPSRIFRFPEGPKRLYALALMTFALALLSAPIAVCTLPLVMLAIVWWKQDDFSRKDALAIVPLVVMAIGAVTVSLIAERFRDTSWQLSPLNSVLLAGHAIWFYAREFFWPTGLTVIHKNWIIGPADLKAWIALVAIFFSAAVLWARRYAIGRAPFAALAVYVLLLLPVITPINKGAIQTSYVAERFNYLACGAAAAVVIGTIAGAAHKNLREMKWPQPVAAGGLIIVLFFAVFTNHANTFASSIQLWQNTADQDPENTAALIHLAQTYEGQKNGLPQAIELYQRILRLTDRKNVDALLGLGNLFEKQDLNESIDYYQEAMLLAPNRPEPVRQLGTAMMKQKNFDPAINLYQEAIKRFPKDGSMYQQLGRAQQAKGNLDQAMDSFKTAVALDPYSSSIRGDLATIYFLKGDGANARLHLDKAFQLDPKNFELYMSVGEMCVRIRDWENAYVCYRSASYLHSDAPEPCNNVGFVLTVQSQLYWKKGQVELASSKIKEAIVYFQRAIDLNPDFESAKKNLKTAQSIQHQEAVTAPPSQAATRAAASQPVGTDTIQPADAPATQPASPH